MAVQRSGPTPTYGEYVTRRVVIPTNQAASPQVLQLGSNIEWFEIPTYQRGITWTADQLDEFIGSPSILLGNVIFGSFPKTAAQQYCPTPSYLHLVDGLQRFAVGTALLNEIHDRYIGPNPMQAHLTHHFPQLPIFYSTWSPIYKHNDVELSNYKRTAIRDQYVGLKKSVRSWFQAVEDDQRLPNIAPLLERLFNDRQIAVDVYFNFPSALSLMGTFIGLNTVRVDLGYIDLFRSVVVERATSDQWPDSTIEDIENRFTETFVNDQKPIGDLLPFATVCYQLSTSGKGDQIFPSWASTLTDQEVDGFLQFVADFLTASHSPELAEIRSVGSIPFGICLAYYYRVYRTTGTRPAFLTGSPTVGESAELITFLRACYRVLLAGRIGRTREFIEPALTSSKPLVDVAEDMAVRMSNKSLTSQLDLGYLIGILKGIDRQKSKRIFNAMLLPISGGASYSPLAFGRKSVEYNVDHIIPESLIQGNAPGASEVNRIQNFVPLPQNDNIVARATSASQKLAVGGLYRNVRGVGAGHPYMDFLIQQFDSLVAAGSSAAAKFDDQRLLEANQSPGIGDERIQEIASTLQQRL